MKINLKSVLFVFSLILNGIFISMFITASFAKSSSLYFRALQDDYTAAAAVVSFPKNGAAVFQLIEIALKPQEKAFFQFSFVSSQNKQLNLLINALYDPAVISVSHTGYGVEITALSEGETLMQTVTNEGIKNIAFIKVSK